MTQATATDLTAQEKILLAIDHAIGDNNGQPFTAAAIVIVSWQEYPADFGLEGFEAESADSNKILLCKLPGTPFH